ncbi:general secretion pathway protein GspB [Fontimonas sp. SYSU GA230001]|uniref:general secretion pathway protein GspB n=1 Tax=Fontimonas sp. SYSU GA230001 TaxID=3142450 RepID=UPI0032B5E88C
MSYILDALKRAEHERSTGAASASPAGDPADPGLAFHPATLILAGATLFLAGLGAAALLFRLASVAPPATEPLPTQRSAIEARPTASPIVQVLEQQPASDPVQAEPALATAPPPLALDEYGQLDDITPVFQGSAGPAKVPAPSPAQATVADPVAPQVTTLRLDAPQLDEMPADYRRRFPDIQVQVHVHDADPARRWIMVDGRRYAEGSVLAQGPRVAEILADGLILEFDGQRVHWPLGR